MYCSVRASSGFEKILRVEPYSARRPERRSPSSVSTVPSGSTVVKKAVRSLTRAACCMLWVTMTIVYSDLISSMSSSIRVVAMGSRAEQGSSMRSTSGSVATARAMQRRCC